MLNNETCVCLTELSRRLPRLNGKRIAISTLWRWAMKGIHGERLESRRLGKRLLSSVEAVDRFSARLSDRVAEEFKKTAPPPPARRTTTRQAEREQARAEAALTAAGILPAEG